MPLALSPHRFQNCSHLNVLAYSLWSPYHSGARASWVKNSASNNCSSISFRQKTRLKPDFTEKYTTAVKSCSTAENEYSSKTYIQHTKMKRIGGYVCNNIKGLIPLVLHLPLLKDRNKKPSVFRPTAFYRLKYFSRKKLLTCQILFVLFSSALLLSF